MTMSEKRRYRHTQVGEIHKYIKGGKEECLENHRAETGREGGQGGGEREGERERERERERESTRQI